MPFLHPLLDHVVVNVLGDLDAAADRYRELGFQLTPRGHHTLGTSNNLAIFGTDYLELLGYERGKPATRPDLVDTPPGLAGLVFKPPAEGLVDALTEADIAFDPSRDFSRPIDLPGGARDASFRTTNLRGVLDGGRVFFCQHHTPELVWRDEWRRHPNGATGIAAFCIAAADPAHTAAPLARLFGPLRPIDDGLALQAGTARIDILSPEGATRRYGDDLLGLGAGRDRMVGLDLRTAGPGLIVPASQACGVALRFVEG